MQLWIFVNFEVDLKYVFFFCYFFQVEMLIFQFEIFKFLKIDDLVEVFYWMIDC